MVRHKVKWKGVVPSRGEAIPFLEHPSDSVLVERGRPRLLIMLCPCGCGEQIVLNIDPQAGPAWRLYRNTDQEDSFTLYPSVWRDTGCESHFIVWRGKILGLGSKTNVDLEEELLMKVLGVLSKSYTHYEEIASTLEENPWSVLWACQQLVTQKLANSREKDTLFSKAESS